MSSSEKVNPIQTMTSLVLLLVLLLLLVLAASSCTCKVLGWLEVVRKGP
ncbi:MAG: hypothetical protein ACOX52_15295 [Verrucomicrobiota bacterium]